MTKVSPAKGDRVMGFAVAWRPASTKVRGLPARVEAWGRLIVVAEEKLQLMITSVEEKVGAEVTARCAGGHRPLPPPEGATQFPSARRKLVVPPPEAGTAPLRVEVKILIRAVRAVLVIPAKEPELLI